MEDEILGFEEAKAAEKGKMSRSKNKNKGKAVGVTEPVLTAIATATGDRNSVSGLARLKSSFRDLLRI